MFLILFVCNLSRSSHLILGNSHFSVSMYSFPSLLFHINVCGLSSSEHFEVFVSSRIVGYFHEILSSIRLWSEKVVIVCTEKSTISSLFGKCFLKSKQVHCATTVTSKIGEIMFLFYRLVPLILML